MTPEQIQACTGSTLALATTYAPSLTAGMAQYDISTPQRQAAFLAQIGHESGGLRYVREIWGPTPDQERYEGRADLGNTQPGDGQRFMGRNFMQTTGRANYTTLAGALCVDCVERPELLEKLPWCALGACWEWWQRGLNELADADEFKQITRIINGGYGGIDDRLERWQRARQSMGLT